MAKLTLLLGPVGAGKTTYGLRLCKTQSAVFFNLDEWMTQLFRPDRPNANRLEWYLERTHRCKEQILRMAERCLCDGVDVVLEIGLVRRQERDDFFVWADGQEVDCHIVVFDVDRELRRERVLQRNEEKGQSYSMEVPMEYFELASNAWEPVEAYEIEGREYRVL